MDGNDFSANADGTLFTRKGRPRSAAIADTMLREGVSRRTAFRRLKTTREAQPAKRETLLSSVPVLATPPRYNAASWEDRIANLRRVVGGAYLFRSTDDDGGRWITGVWLFNDYRRHAEYHGAYMRHLLKRYDALFFDRGPVLHVCSGALTQDNEWLPGDTLDAHPEPHPGVHPTYVVDAQTCAGVPLGDYWTVFVDPPYTKADAAKYRHAAFPSRNRILATLAEGLPVGALIVWLDETAPRRTKQLYEEADWGVRTSAGHRLRGVTVYRKVRD
jgi:hypothetical protein